MKYIGFGSQPCCLALGLIEKRPSTVDVSIIKLHYHKLSCFGLTSVDFLAEALHSLDLVSWLHHLI